MVKIKGVTSLLKITLFCSPWSIFVLPSVRNLYLIILQIIYCFQTKKPHKANKLNKRNNNQHIREITSVSKKDNSVLIFIDPVVYFSFFVQWGADVKAVHRLSCFCSLHRLVHLCVQYINEWSL